MADPRFYLVAGPFNLRKLATAAEAEIGGSGEPEQAFLDVRPLAEAGPEHVSFLDNKLYVDEFIKSRAGVCIVHPDSAVKAPTGMALCCASGGHCWAGTDWYTPSPPDMCTSCVRFCEFGCSGCQNTIRLLLL